MNKARLLILVGIVLLGTFLRFYRVSELFEYGHDQDLASWAVKDVVVNGHPRLIGQETSTAGIFIGPAYYYYLIPFYVASNMDPYSSTLAVGILGVLWIISFYFVGSKMFGNRVGMIAALLYAVSYYTVANDREAVPTQPVIVWALWFLYSTYLVYKGKTVGFVLAGILIGLIWHLNLALMLLLPLLAGSIVLTRRHFGLAKLAVLVGVCAIVSIPLITFELRHNFSQSRAFITSLSLNQHDIVSGIQKIERVIHLTAKNLANFVIGSSDISYGFFAAGLIFVAALLFNTKKFRGVVGVFGLWLALVIGFFSVYSKILSEYYLNSLIVVFLFVIAMFADRIWETKKGLAMALLFVFAGWNMIRLHNVSSNNNTYMNRVGVVEAIAQDAAKRDFECVSVSYITSPGYDLGYRFLFYKSNIRVNRPASLAPVYSIVFPLARVHRVDKTFGGIGLIYPDYNRYVKTINDGCANSRNDNLTDPLWGYTD